MSAVECDQGPSLAESLSQRPSNPGGGNYSPASDFNKSALSVFSQLKSMSSRPRCP